MTAPTEMPPYCAWQIVGPGGRPWYQPQRTRGDAIATYIARALLPSERSPAAWAREKRRGFRCQRVLVKQWGTR